MKNTGRFRLDHDLNSAPWIDRDLVSWELYAEKNGNFKRTPGTYVMAGRDCWHAKCTFCSWTTLYPTYRTRDPVDVVDEIESLVARYGVKEIMDDSGSFPVGRWLETFCNEMIARGLNRKVRIDCNMRFGRLGFEDYALMRKAGFRLVLFGVESANQDTLDRFVKALKVEDVERGAELASKAGLDVHLTFMFGHAWEGPAEMANTVRLARRLLANGHAATLQCTLTIPYPGTPLFRELKASNGLTTLDWDDYDQRTRRLPRLSAAACTLAPVQAQSLRHFVLLARLPLPARAFARLPGRSRRQGLIIPAAPRQAAKSAAALAEVVSARLSAGEPLSLARNSNVCVTKAGSLGRPRFGTGAR